MEQKFLLIFSFKNTEGMYRQGFDWYLTEEEMMIDIEDKKEYLKNFKMIEAMEILSARDIDIK